ncbi:MAG: hypothetical protein RCO49_09545 [Rickettsia endosymbiont of Argas persicus]
MQRIEDTADQINDLNIGTEETTESEEKIINSSSNPLDEKLKLINGTELKVKTISQHLLDPGFISDVLRDISPESYQQLKKCIFSALKSTNAKEAFKFVNSLGNPDLVNDWFDYETYDNDTVDCIGATGFTAPYGY